MKLAMLGQGAMGQRMAERARQAGHTVTVFNRTPRVLEGYVPTPAEAVRDADVVVSMLTDVPASQAVWNDALPAMRSDAVCIESSTVTPAFSKTLAHRASERGLRYLEAPVVGTRPHAEAGALMILVGGDGQWLDEVRPVLESWGSPRHVGEVGQAMALKLAINSLFAGQVVLLTEAVAGLGAEGVGQERALELLKQTPVFAPVLEGISALLLANDDAPRFPVALVEKDLRYACDETSLPLFDAVRQRYAAARQAGWGAKNLHAVGRLLTNP